MERSFNADLCQVSCNGSPWYYLAIPIWPPRSRGENEWHHGQTMCCTFRVYLLRHYVLEFSLNCFFFSFFFFFFTLIPFDKNENAVPMQTTLIFLWPGENKLHYCETRVYKMICFLDRSRSLVWCFDSGPWVASFVRMRHDMLLLHNWDNNYLFCSRTRL